MSLIHGGGVAGTSYQIDADAHVGDPNGQLVFPEARHVRLFYRNAVLVVLDEGSPDGVFVRVRGTVEIVPGDRFMVGDQTLQFDADPKTSDSRFRVTQILPGGSPGLARGVRGHSMKIGREDADLNFPEDQHVSGSHCMIEERGGTYSLTDLSSRNGTYIRLKTERELVHGDYVFIGKKLLRVEIAAT